MAPIKTEDDPVTAEYDVYITPEMTEQVFMLQYPIRDRMHPYNVRSAACPIEMRIKPESGFIESDIAIDTNHNFNKKDGLEWGMSLKKSQSQGVDTFGAAAGFGPGLNKQRAIQVPGAVEPQRFDHDIDSYRAALAADQVLCKQTLGGQILRAEVDQPNYMLGAFRNNELHLTRIDGIAQMRPQFHHVDAKSHLEGQKPREPGDVRPPAQARAALQSYKGSQDQEDARLVKERGLWQLAQEEPWMRLRYYDEDDAPAYDTYHSKLFVSQTNDCAKLRSSMNNEVYLEAISAPRHEPGGGRKKKPLTRKQRTAIELDEDDVHVPLE